MFNEKNIKEIISELKKNDIVYIDEDTYDTSEIEGYYSTEKTEDFWDEILNCIVMPFIRKHNLNIYNSDLSVNYVARDEQGYYLTWYNPDCFIYLKDIATTELPKAFMPYVMDSLDWIKFAKEKAGLDVEKHQLYEIATGIDTNNPDLSATDLSHPIVDEDPEVVDDKIQPPYFVVSNQKGYPISGELNEDYLVKFLKAYFIEHGLY